MNRKISLNMSQLKTIAMVFMLIDHIAYAMIERGLGLSGELYMINRVMRSMGRIAFPIFCFTIVEGFQKTSNTREYMKRLIIFALISEIPFDMAFRGAVFDNSLQNVFWTLAFGLGAMMIYTDPFMLSWQKAIGLLACFYIPYLFHTDYTVYGVLTIFFMYLFRREPLKMCMAGYIVLLLQNSIEVWAVFGFLLLLFYNGQRGSGGKWFTYWYYPVHLLALALARPYVLSILSSFISKTVLI
jgi:hypothetical protein